MAINGATNLNVFTELKPIKTRVCQLLTAWLALPQRETTYRFASGRENDARCYNSKTERLIEIATYLLFGLAEKKTRSIRLHRSLPLTNLS
jgi:hypothetical protein